MSNVIGFSLLDLTAYLERRWRILILILPVFFLGTISFVFLVPESLEWLFMTGQAKRACNQLQKIMYSYGMKSNVYDELFYSVAQSQRELRNIVDKNDKVNDKVNDDVDDDDRLAAKTATDAEEEEAKEDEKREDEKEDEEVEERELLLMMSKSSIFSSKRRRWNYPTVVVVSAVAGLTLINYFIYYGLVLGTDEFSGDRYLNFFLFALADLGGVIIAMALISYVNRRRIIGGAYVVIAVMAAAVLCFVLLVGRGGSEVFYNNFLLGGHLLIKINILAAVAVVELSSVEMPPTAVRSIANGIFFACKGLAGVTASFVPWLLRNDAYAESVFLGLALLAIGLLFALPEMKGVAIPRDEDDLRNNFRKTKLKFPCLAF